MKLVHLFIAWTVMLLANDAGAQSAVETFHPEKATISDVHAAAATRSASVAAGDNHQMGRDELRERSSGSSCVFLGENPFHLPAASVAQASRE
jgi:hypothetical protein